MLGVKPLTDYSRDVSSLSMSDLPTSEHDRIPLLPPAPLVGLTIVWLADPSEPPLPPAAVEIAVSSLVERIGVTISANATLIVGDHAGLGGYPLLRAYGAGTNETWSTSHEILVRELDGLADSRLAVVGIGPEAVGFERAVARLFRRRLPHFSDAQLRELDALAPRLAEIAAETLR